MGARRGETPPLIRAAGFTPAGRVRRPILLPESKPAKNLTALHLLVSYGQSCSLGPSGVGAKAATESSPNRGEL